MSDKLEIPTYLAVTLAFLFMFFGAQSAYQLTDSCIKGLVHADIYGGPKPFVCRVVDWTAL